MFANVCLAVQTGSQVTATTVHALRENVEMGDALTVLTKETARLAADKAALAAKQRASQRNAELLETAEAELLRQNNAHIKVRCQQWSFTRNNQFAAHRR